MQIVCRSDYDKKKAVQWCHNNRASSEPCNVKDTIKMLQKSYYWHGLNKDIEKRVSISCSDFFCGVKWINLFSVSIISNNAKLVPFLIGVYKVASKLN